MTLKPGSARMHVSEHFLHLGKSIRWNPSAMIHLPLARRTVRAAQTARIVRAVLPPSNGGLHCGDRSSLSLIENGRVLPPSNGGLHCGETRPVLTVNGPVTCSRRRTAGSIAASIQVGVVVQGGQGAPAVERRAPLRHDHRQRVGVERAGAPAVERRAPLRPHHHHPDRLHLVPCSRRRTAGSIAA